MRGKVGFLTVLCWLSVVSAASAAGSSVASGDASGAAPAAASARDAEPVNESATDSSIVSAMDADMRPWLDENGPTDDARSLLHLIGDSAIHGLGPYRYGYSDLEDRQSRLAEVSNPLSAADAALWSQTMTKVFRQFLTDLGGGVTNPLDVQNRWYRAAPDIDTDALLQTVVRGEQDVMEIVQAVIPQHDAYRNLTEQMRSLLDERNSGRVRTRVETLDARWIGEEHPAVPAIRQRLIETGDLFIGSSDGKRYDGEVMIALEEFQIRHALEPSGVLDAPTRDAMNTSVEADITAVAISLERWRWMPRDLGERYVWVNIPDFQLELVDAGHVNLSMPVVVGSPRRRTPVFSRPMSYIEFNPTWTVPRSIAERDLLPRELESPGYLAARDFIFLDVIDGQLQETDPENITPEVLAMRPFPYFLRQLEGAGNAMGDMKFMMPNPWAIYLHDTPGAAQFEKPYRAHSNGCIRLRDPESLASELLMLQGQTNKDVMRLMHGRDNVREPLQSGVQTHLVYFTHWIDHRGVLQSRPDIYHHDAKLAQALRQAGTLLSELNQS